MESFDNTKGVALAAFGSEAYMWWAVNMACTLKHYSPQVPVQLIASEPILSSLKLQKLESLFDYLTTLETTDYLTESAALFPAKAKLSLPSYFAFDTTLYMDVDGAVIKDVSPLLQLPFKLVMQVNSWYRP